MLKLFLIGLLLACSINVMSQNHDKRLEAKYSKSEIDQMMTDSPEMYNALVFDLDKAWYVTDMHKDASDAARTENIQLADETNVNILELGVDILEDDYQYFRINGGNKMLVIRSRKHINILRNNQTSQK